PPQQAPGTNHRQRRLHDGPTHVPTPASAVEARPNVPGLRVVVSSAPLTRSARPHEVAAARRIGRVGPTGRARAADPLVSSVASDVPLRLTR
ncbi:MAG TPA: hypothetical protein VK662_15570, partial [Acidothermaceae bacterium]|nr:hypothetical protein [Acidothermaceae bacterium]